MGRTTHRATRWWLRLGGSARPMGELTSKVLGEWLGYRQRRWPPTANPHLLVSRESALHHGPVSGAWIINLRGLPATLERLRVDRQLTEAMATGFDPLHLVQVFGISEQAAIRYAVNAQQLGAPHWDLPQHPRPPLPLGHDRSGMGGLRAVTAGQGVAGWPWWPPSPVLHARHR